MQNETIETITNITLTQTELVNDYLLNLKGNTFITASVETSVALKAGHPFEGTVKQSQNLNGALGFSYSNSVARLEEKEGSEIHVETQPRKWGTLSENRVVVFHTPKGETDEKFYLNMKVESRPSEETSFFFIEETGKQLDSNLVNEWKKTASKPSTQAHLEGAVIVRDIKLENIKTLKMKGQIFEINGK
jgi:hypothetical protein